MNAVNLAKLIVEKTEPGRVTDWVERIAQIATVAEVPKSMINWNNSPATVAYNLADYAEKNGQSDNLQAAAETYQSDE